MSTSEIRKKIESEPDFVNLKRYDFSLEKLLDKFPDGVPNKMIAQALLMTEEEVEKIYQQVVLKLRKEMKVDEA
jgi:hypothetical protein